MSIDIKNENIDLTGKIPVNKALWGTKYIPEVYARIVYDISGFTVKFTVNEKNPLREKTKHFEYVHEDSCVEFFANFDPEHSERYINFEANANGVMNAAFMKNRYDTLPLENEDIEGLGIKADVFEDYWTLTYKVGVDFIKKYYPEFDIKKCKYIMGNLYKCGDNTKEKHYLCCFDVKCETPDFHRSEYFGKINLI